MHTSQIRYTINYTEYQVPAVYQRLVGQLVAEQAHGNKHNSHESRRRLMYARKVIDAFAKEIILNSTQPPESRIPPESFRSKVLTPILQRQLRAVHDAYMPSVCRALTREGEATLTISRVTEIYLHQDPTLPYLAPRYRRHLLYVPEPRWYLGILVHPAQMGNSDFYFMVREHHEQILMAVREEKKKGSGEGQTLRDPHGMPVLRRVEVRAIVREGLEEFFAHELSAVVFHPTPPLAIPITDHCPCSANYWRR